MKKTNIVVKLQTETYTFPIEDIFDDPFMEACTRLVEYKCKTQSDFAIPPCLFASLDRKGAKHHVYNSYIVMVNAGFHKYAEILRANFIKNTGVDLQKEPIKSK